MQQQMAASTLISTKPAMPMTAADVQGEHCSSVSHLKLDAPGKSSISTRTVCPTFGEYQIFPGPSSPKVINGLMSGPPPLCELIRRRWFKNWVFLIRGVQCDLCSGEEIWAKRWRLWRDLARQLQPEARPLGTHLANRSKTGFGVKEGGGTFGRRLRTQVYGRGEGIDRGVVLEYGWIFRSNWLTIGSNGFLRFRESGSEGGYQTWIDSSHPPSSRSSKTENRGELNRLGAGFPVPMNPETSNCSDATLRGLIVWANPAVIKLVWLPVSKNTDDACPDSADKLVETGIDLESVPYFGHVDGRLASTIGKARRWVNPLGGPVEERGGVCWAQLGGALGLPMLVWVCSETPFSDCADSLIRTNLASPCRHSADVQVCPLSTSFSSKYILASRVRPIGDKGVRRPLTTSGVRPVHLKPMEAVGAPIVDRAPF
uniref:Uncharacterized protein n=1 Tax=Globodera pallida TaxID=36090 RepID=A0A183BU59_GLOPA